VGSLWSIDESGEEYLYPADCFTPLDLPQTERQEATIMEEGIQVGYQVFTSDGGEEIGAVRRILRDRRGLVVYIENAGDCEIPSEAIAAVHSQKVILKWDKLSAELKDAIRHAHDAELPDGEDAEK
jgi:hypothetical protein